MSRLSDVMLTEDDHFSIMEKYFSEKGPVFHQFENYEYMYDTLLQKIIDETPSIHIDTKTQKYKATFGQVYVEKASYIDNNNVIRNLTPKDARLQDITYEAPVFVDIIEEFWEPNEHNVFEKVNEIEHQKILLMKIPVMVRSSRCALYGLSMDECIQQEECFNDPGGYFIINGKERALICQERLNYNQVYVFESNDDKYPYSADIRSMSEETGHSVLIQARMNKEMKNISFNIPYMSKEVPAGTVFKALGMNSHDIVRFINPSSKEERILVDRLIRESIAFTDKKAAIQHISKATMHKVEDDEERRIIYTEQVIENELFPHMGISTPIEKCIFLGDMLSKLFRVTLRKRLEDDRDNVSLKRIEGPGVLVADLFRMSMKRYCDTLKKYLEKRQDIITAMNRSNSITSIFRHTFSTGNWAAQKNTYIRTGVSQIMSRLTYPATISHLRRVVIPVGKEGKNVKIRQIHPTQSFFIDVIESPEGKSIGIVKNLALLANITTGCNSILIREIVEGCRYVYTVDKYFDRSDWSNIYLNGTLLGLTYRPEDLYRELAELRKLGVLSNQVSFYYDREDRELRVFCDHGRYLRPVMTVDSGNSLKMRKEDLSKTWSDLVEHDIIRYVDSNEVENSLIAMVPSDLQKYNVHAYDYCEIHPSAMLGVCSAVIPYPEHNQSPRLVYQSSMVKQALGIYALSFKQRFDTVTHVMHYPQKPMVSTKFDKMLHYDEMMTGCNPIVAVLTYGGFNQEDSVMLNRSAVDRGMFVHTCYKTLSCEENKKTNCSFERIEVPPPKAQNKTFNYSKLGKNGIAMKGVPVHKGDIIIGKTLTKVQKDEDEKTDCSLSIGNGEEGIVDDVWEGLNEEGYKMVKVRIRQLRIPEIGDKFASRSSQKGVCGLLLPQEDMPFTQEGITPDLMINPHCFTAESKVSLYNGLSRKITDLSQDGSEKVWTYDYNNNGLVARRNLGMEWKGKRPIVKLTFEDGRTVRCTPDHKFHVLTEEKGVQKIEAKDLKLGEHKIIMGLEGVEDVNYGDEDGWTLQTENFTFSCKNVIEREKALAFARILGFVLTDGCVFKSKTPNSDCYICPVHFGHLIDADIFLQDVFLLTGKIPKIQTSGQNGKANTYLINLPAELSKSIGMLDGVTNGRRTRQESDWPTFLYNCPKSVLREFLAGMFGGDGHSPYIQGRNGTQPVGVKISKSIHNDFKDSFAEKMNHLCELLNKFDCEATIERVREYKVDNKDDLFYSYYVDIGNSLSFSQKIGFRYCSEKNGRITLFKAYKEFQERVKAQSEKIFELIDKYCKEMSVNKALEKAREEFLLSEAPLNEYYSLCTKTQVDNRKKATRSQEIRHLSYKYFPTFQEFLENMGCAGWYSKDEYTVKRGVDALPTFYMKAIRMDDCGEDDTYCIGVEEFHNFICEGAVVTNCIPSRMTMSQLIEMLLGKTSALTGELGDSTAFSKGSINPTEDISKQLERLGFERNGNERLMSGYTGEMLQADIFIGTAYYQRLKHLVKDKMHCLTLDHEVLTSTGWKPIYNITMSDSIATLSIDEELVYQKPTHVWRYSNYSGELYHLRNDSVDLVTTSNHRMWVTSKTDENGDEDPRYLNHFRFVEASQCLGKEYVYKKDAIWNKQGYMLQYTDSFDETNDLIRLYYHRVLTENDEKWIFSLSAPQTRLLVNAVTHGFSVFTDTKENVDRLQRLCLHAGWSADISEIPNAQYTKRIDIHRNYHYPSSSPSDERMVTVEADQGIDVMCVTVPNEIFYVRRNGKPVWTGNSRARGNVTMMHHQPSEGRSKDGGLRTGEMERDALIAHGGSAFIQETFFDMSDVYQVNICENCGSIVSTAKECRVCKKGDINKTNIPYCAKLLLQELQALGVSIKINTAP